MRRERNFWVIGGDMRQVKLAQLLWEDGHTVHTYALEGGPVVGAVQETELGGAALADCVILPLPVSGEGTMLNAPMAEKSHPLTEVFAAFRPGQILCGGMVNPLVAAQAELRGLAIQDYNAREEFAVANAVPTAEGAVQIAMEELPITLHGARVLVVGFGRVGKITAGRFAALGARVTVAARKYADLAWGAAYGYATEHTDELGGFLCAYDLVVNTVPSCILTEERLQELKPGCVVLDLASKPGGIDFEAAGALGVKAIWALSIPGKVAPVTAGAAIRDTIYNILREMGVR